MYLVEKFKWRYHLLHTLGYVLNWCCDECVFPCVCVEWMYPIDSVHRNCEAFGSVHTARYKEYLKVFLLLEKFQTIERPEGKNRMRLIQIEWKGVNGCLLQLFDWKWFFFCLIWISMARPFRMIPHHIGREPRNIENGNEIKDKKDTCQKTGVLKIIWDGRALGLNKTCDASTFLIQSTMKNNYKSITRTFVVNIITFMVRNCNDDAMLYNVVCSVIKISFTTNAKT